ARGQGGVARAVDEQMLVPDLEAGRDAASGLGNGLPDLERGAALDDGAAGADAQRRVVLGAQHALLDVHVAGEGAVALEDEALRAELDNAALAAALVGGDADLVVPDRAARVRVATLVHHQ